MFTVCFFVPSYKTTAPDHLTHIQISFLHTGKAVATLLKSTEIHFEIHLKYRAELSLALPQT